MSDWTYLGKEINADDYKDCVGFVYMIHNLQNGRSYIGKKNLWRTQIRPPLKGQKRKRKTILESDWKDYWSSSDNLKKDIEELGQDKFKREILTFCKTKGDLSYEELKLQMFHEVLKNDKFYNNIIQVRIHGKHLSK